MSSRFRVLLGLLLGINVTSCYRDITVVDVKKTIELCKTNARTVRDEFGPPDSIGMLEDLVTNTYRRHRGSMVVVFVNDIVVDVVVNPAGIVEFRNRCKTQPRPVAPPKPTTTPNTPTPDSVEE
jgi:hypothetical protein